MAITDPKKGSINDRTATTAMLALLPGLATFSAAAEGSNARVLTIQLKDAKGANVAAKTRVTVWLGATAGGVPAATAPDGTVAFSTGTVLKEHTSKVLWDVVSDVTGKLVVSIGESGVKSFYAHVAQGNGPVSESAAIAFA